MKKAVSILAVALFTVSMFATVNTNDQDLSNTTNVDACDDCRSDHGRE